MSPAGMSPFWGAFLIHACLNPMRPKLTPPSWLRSRGPVSSLSLVFLIYPVGVTSSIPLPHGLARGYSVMMCVKHGTVPST